jgi:hypothetical protein
MMITSFGAAGYLSTAMQNGIAGVEKLDTQISFLKTEKAKLETRKLQIDTQIAAIPPDANTKFRNNIISNFNTEQVQITGRISELDAQIPKLELEKIEIGGKSSSIVSLAKSFGIDTNSAIKYLVFVIIFVFDPFAIYLIMCGNHVMMKSEVVKPTKIVEFEVPDQPPTPKIKSVTQDPESSEPVVESEFEPLTTGPFRSTLEDVEAPNDLFDNDFNLPSRVVSTYATGPQPFHVKVKK